MTQQRTARIFEHPLAFGSLRVWLGLLIENRSVDRKFLLRALVVTLSTFATSPLRIYESLRYRKAVERTEIALDAYRTPPISKEHPYGPIDVGQSAAQWHPHFVDEARDFGVRTERGHGAKIATVRAT